MTIHDCEVRLIADGGRVLGVISTADEGRAGDAVRLGANECVVVRVGGGFAVVRPANALLERLRQRADE